MKLARLVVAAFVLAAACARAAEPDTPPPAFRLEIAAPSKLEEALRESLDIVRWQRYDALTDDLLEPLLAEARVQARDIVAAEGFFSPEIDVSAERGADGRVVRIAVTPGEPTRVRTVRVEVTGAVLDEPGGAARVAAVREAWPLQAGDVFTQSGWEVAKGLAISVLSAERFAGAGIANSRATIDPAAHAADLEVTLASGPPLVFGEVQITGLAKYPEEVVRNLSPIHRGEPYSREKLEVYQRRLTATNYFASVQVAVDTDPARPGELPVRVSLIEAPKRKVDVGIGYSTDTLFRFQLDYRDANVFGTDHRLTSTLRYETKVQSLSATVESPPDTDAWYNIYSADLRATQIQGLDTESVSAGFVRKLADERNQPAWGLGYILERQEPEGLPADTTYALVGSVWYTWRRTDELLSPRRGWNAAVQLAAAPPGVSSRTFGRAIGKAVVVRAARPQARRDRARRSRRSDRGHLERHPAGDAVPHRRRHDRARLRVREPRREERRRRGRRSLLRPRERRGRVLGLGERRHRGIRRRRQRGRPGERLPLRARLRARRPRAYARGTAPPRHRLRPGHEGVQNPLFVRTDVLRRCAG